MCMAIDTETEGEFSSEKMSLEEQMKAARGGSFVSLACTCRQAVTYTQQGKGIVAYADLLEKWRADGSLEGLSVQAAE